MSRRIDIELTSRREDGSWTWRAPGARQPRGSLEGGLLPPSAKVGDVLRAEADFDLEGITVVAVQAPRPEESNGGPERIEVVGSGRDKVDGVSVVLAPGGRRPRDDAEHERRPRRAAGERGAGRGGPRRPPGGPGGAGRDERPDRTRAARPPDSGRPERAGNGRPAGGRAARGGTEPRGTEPRGTEARNTEPRPSQPRLSQPRGGAERSSERRGGRDEPRRERPRRPEAVTTHRNAALAALSPEQIPVAEQLLRGGIPSVRQAIDEQNARARAEGRAEVSPEPLLRMAEELQPRMSLATWKDRAVSLRGAGRDAPLREMRSVVAGASTVTLDDEARELVAGLRQALDTRVTALRETWLARIVTALDDGRVADALRVTARPPEPAVRVPAELAVRLAEAAGTAMAPTVGEEAWTDLLDAVVKSPVRRTVKPVGLPPDPSAALVTAARQAAGLVPELARLLGLPIPPPPGPRRVGAVTTRRS